MSQDQLVSLADVESLEVAGFHEVEITVEPQGLSNPYLERFFLSFLERSIRDYMELDPTSQKKSSEYSDGSTESDEWMSAARFIYGGGKALPGMDLTFQDVCDLLDINTSTILSRIDEAVGGKREDHWDLGESTVG